jgi:hypothetical protein
MPQPAAPARLPGVTWFAPSWPVLSSPSTSDFEPGSYVTDGWRLFRVVSPIDPGVQPSLAWLEDCMTLSVESYTSDELWEMDLRLVRRSDAA